MLTYHKMCENKLKTCAPAKGVPASGWLLQAKTLLSNWTNTENKSNLQ